MKHNNRLANVGKAYDGIWLAAIVIIVATSLWNGAAVIADTISTIKMVKCMITSSNADRETHMCSVD